MSTLTDYKRMNVVTPDPTGSGGLAINNNFKSLADRFGDLQTTDPTASNDNTQGFAVGSRWFNTSTNIEWVCTNDATGAAVWKAISSQWTTSGTTISYSGGNVGIGTSSPDSILSLSGSNPALSFRDTAQTSPAGRFEIGSSGDTLRILSRAGLDNGWDIILSTKRLASGNVTFAFTGAASIHANTTATALSVTQSGSGYAATFTGGNVGIGTTTPGTALDVSGDTSSRTVIAKPQSSAPSSPTAGQIYYDGTASHFYGWNGTAWKQLDN